MRNNNNINWSGEGGQAWKSSLMLRVLAETAGKTQWLVGWWEEGGQKGEDRQMKHDEERKTTHTQSQKEFQT